MRLIILLTLIVFPTKALAESMADLSALAERGLWSEVLEKVEKVPASERTSDWDKIVIQAVGKTLESDSDNVNLNYIESLMSRYAFLGQDSSVCKSSQARLAKDFANCVSQSYNGADNCSKLAGKVVAACKELDQASVKSAGDEITRFNRALSLRVYGKLFAHAADTKDLCKDENITSAVLKALEGPADGELTMLALELTKSSCGEEMLAAVKNGLTDNSPKSDYYKNACPLLISSESLSGLQLKRCQNL